MESNFTCSCGRLHRWARLHEGNRQSIGCSCGITHSRSLGESRPKPVAWLLTNQDGGKRIVFGELGTPLADESWEPILADDDRGFTLASPVRSEGERDSDTIPEDEQTLWLAEQVLEKRHKSHALQAVRLVRQLMVSEREAIDAARRTPE